MQEKKVTELKKVSGEVMGCIVEWRGNYTDIMQCYCSYYYDRGCLIKDIMCKQNNLIKKMHALIKPSSSKKKVVNAEVKGCATVLAIADVHISIQYCPDPYCKFSDEDRSEKKDCYYDSEYEPGTTYAIIKVWPEQEVEDDE